MEARRSNITMVGKLPAPTGEMIVDTAIELFRTGFPNTERHGCPSAMAIRAAARRDLKRKETDVLEHLTCCSPCFAQFERALEGAERTKHNK